MTSIATIIEQRRAGSVSAILPLLVVALLMLCSAASAQVSQGAVAENSVLDTIPEEARAVFDKYVQQQDTASLIELNKHRKDKFIKRVSFHTNVVDWATLVPNFGIEVDLKDTPRNNYSIFLHGKFNGNSRHGKLVYNVNAVRVEGRKYWRTGKYGKRKEYHETIERLYTDPTSVYFNADTVIGYSYYVDDSLGRIAKDMGVRIRSVRAHPDMTQAQIDSLDFAEDSIGIRKNKFREWFYNNYHKVRRNVTSGRTLENPRNWRAYYLGLWAGIDNWSVSLSGKGKQGQGIGAGVVLGYTLPLLPQSYPHEGSLDLDLGLAVGLKAVKYDAYVYEEHTQHYMYDQASSSPSWKIVPYPVIQDIHVSLVWRFRGIKNKVDKSLIDDYEKKWIEKYNTAGNDAKNYLDKVKRQRDDIRDEMKRRTGIMTDSTNVWDDFHRRRLDAARRLNPDTTFTNVNDSILYLKLIKGWRTPADREKNLKEQKKQDKERAKQAKRDSIAQAKEAKRILADSLKEARRDSVRMAKESKKVGDPINASQQTDAQEVAPVVGVDEASPTESPTDNGAAEKESPNGLCALCPQRNCHISDEYAKMNN